MVRAGNLEQLVALREPWEALLAACERTLLFETWEWITTWWRHFGGDAELWVLAAWDGEGRLAGVAPWMLVRDGLGAFALRRLTFIGRGIVYPVHLDLLVRPSEEEHVTQALLDYLDAQAGQWDVLDLGDLHPDSALAPCLVGRYDRLKELKGTVARVSRLPATWEIYEKERLSSTRRKHLGQYRRKLEREHPGQVRFSEISSPAELRRALDVFAELNRTRWHGRQNESSFDDDAFVAFHREIASIALEKGWLHFCVLEVGEEMAAAIYAFLYRDVFYAYQATFDQRWAHYGPGQLMLGYTVERAIASGAREWNMMRGEQDYKLSWTDEERVDRHVVVSAGRAGDLWLLGGGLIETAKSFGRERLPAKLQERLIRLISMKGAHRHERARGRDVSD
ncbi:MAG TPA: GNAT family N-acetyltransferase [Anaerolineae bacterium]